MGGNIWLFICIMYVYVNLPRYKFWIHGRWQLLIGKLYTYYRTAGRCRVKHPCQVRRPFLSWEFINTIILLQKYCKFSMRIKKTVFNDKLLCCTIYKMFNNYAYANTSGRNSTRKNVKIYNFYYLAIQTNR